MLCFGLPPGNWIRFVDTISIFCFPVLKTMFLFRRTLVYLNNLNLVEEGGMSAALTNQNLCVVWIAIMCSHKSSKVIYHIQEAKPSLF